MPRGDNTQTGKQGFQPTTRGKTAPKTQKPNRSTPDTRRHTPDSNTAIPDTYTLYRAQLTKNNSAITPDGGMVTKGPTGWNTFDQNDTYLGTYNTEQEAYEAIQAAHRQ